MTRWSESFRFVGVPVLMLVCLLVTGVQCQENAIKNLSPSLIECYNDVLYEKWNLLPQNLETLIAIVRKIEDFPSLNMDLRQLSSALLHRFRQDGIVKNPAVKPQNGIMPYAPLGVQFYRHAQTLRVVPGNAVNFPNGSISALERCSLHNMISSSIDIFERGDEARVCKAANYRRYYRSAPAKVGAGVKDDVETLSPEQLEMMTKGDLVDPSSMYPALPQKHPSSARLTQLPPLSRCPTENGVVKTPWGAVSGGSILAGIAAGLEPQMIRVGDLIRQQLEQRVVGYPAEASLDPRFLGTLAGDLAEVALAQGPQQTGRFSLGADGNWNSTGQPLHYFLNSNENLQMTAAEIRGDLDGLILANQVPEVYKKFSGLRLSQVLDMYYSNRGLFDKNVRACNRRTHLLKVAPTETLITQTHAAALVLSTGIAKATFLNEAIEKFAIQAVKDLSSFVPTMNSDMNCDVNDRIADRTEPAVDLTIIVDTNWPFETIKSILAQLLGGLEISKYNSQFTLINGQDGSVMLNTSISLIDLYTFNKTTYDQFRKGFEFSRALERLRTLQSSKLDDERRRNWAGGKSDVVLAAPYQGSLSENDRELCQEILKRMSEEAPDAVLLFLAHRTKDGWANLVDSNDVFVITVGETTDAIPNLDALQSRIKQVPRRLINSQCGSNYESSSGSSHQLTDYVGPSGVNYYRIHPNYFSSDNKENPPKIRIQSTGVSGPLKVCTSRELLHVNVTQTGSCKTENSHTIEMDCGDASYLHQCKPYYLSVGSTNSSSSTGTFSCTDPRVCRFPDNLQYTISFDQLVCKSGASSLLFAPLLLLLLLSIARFL